MKWVSRCAVIIAAVIVPAGAPRPALAVEGMTLKSQLKVSVTYKKPNNGPDGAEAFSVLLQGVTANDIAKDRNGKEMITSAGLPFFRTVQEVNGLRVTFRDNDNPLADGKALTFSIEFKPLPKDQQGAVPERTVRVRRNDTGWFDGVNGIIKLNEKMSGFNVKGDPIYTLFNDGDDSLDIRDIEFLVNVPEMDLTDVDPFLPLPEVTTTLADLILSPDGMTDPFDVGSLDEKRFMYARGLIFEGDEPVGAFIHEYGFVPEPATLTLLGLAAVALRRRERRRR